MDTQYWLKQLQEAQSVLDKVGCEKRMDLAIQLLMTDRIDSLHDAVRLATEVLRNQR